MSRADTQYLGIIKNILDAGSLGDNRTGMPAYKLPHQIMQFDLEKEFPILTTKFVAFKTSVKEILWIWQKQSNDVRLLQQWNCHVWDEWMREDGTIGKAYGYQLGKYQKRSSKPPYGGRSVECEGSARYGAVSLCVSYDVGCFRRRPLKLYARPALGGYGSWRSF